jgi:hypothetical protein
VLPIPAALVSILCGHRSRQLEARFTAGARWRETGLVFTTANGGFLEPRNINRMFHSLCARQRFHSCVCIIFATRAPPCCSRWEYRRRPCSGSLTQFDHGDGHDGYGGQLKAEPRCEGDLAEIRGGVVDQHDQQPEKGTRHNNAAIGKARKAPGMGWVTTALRSRPPTHPKGMTRAATVTTNNSSCEASDFAVRSHNGGMTLSSCGSGTAVATAR